MLTQTKLLKVSILLAAFILLARLVGGAYQIIVAAYFGATAELDAYLVATSIPNIITEWFIVAAPSVVLIPILIELRTNGKDDEAWRFTCSFANFLFLMAILLILLTLLFGRYMIKALAPGLDDSTADLAIRIMRLVMLIMLPASFNGMLRAILHSYQRFLPSTLSHIASSAAMIVAVLLLLNSMRIFSLVIGLAVGAFSTLLIHLAAARDLKARYCFKLDFKSPFAKKSAKLLIAFMIIGVAAQVNFLSDRFFASFLSRGSISILEYGDKMASFFMLVFASAVAIPSYLIFATHVASKDLSKLKEAVITTIKLIGVITVPILIWSISLREPIVRLTLQHGAFSSQDALSVSTVFAYLSMVSFVYAFAQILIFAFFALQEISQFLLVVVVGILLNIFLDILLVGPLKVAGLAIATAVATAASNLFCWRMLSRRLGVFKLRTLLPFFSRVGLAAAIGGFTAFYVAEILGILLSPAHVTNQLLQVGSALGVAGAIYIGLCLKFRVEEIIQIRSLIRGKFRALPSDTTTIDKYPIA